MSAPVWLGVAGAGALGAPLRYLVDEWVSARPAAPEAAGTILVNVTGSFVLGLIAGLALYHSLPATTRVVLGTGLCGAYTTFSTFSFETARLVEEGRFLRAAANVSVSLLVGGGAAAAGLALAALG